MLIDHNCEAVHLMVPYVLYPYILGNVDMPDMNDMGSHIREKFTPFFNFNSFNPKLGFNNWINQR